MEMVKQLTQLLFSPQFEFIMEVTDFKRIWVSRISISVGLGVQDNEELKGPRPMQETLETAYNSQSIVPVKEAFRLQGGSELEKIEKIYLFTSRKKVNGAIFTFSQSEERGLLTKNVSIMLMLITLIR